MKTPFLPLAAICIFLFSCQSTPKNISYFQDLDSYIAQHQDIDIKYEPVIKNNDQLLITVTSPILDQAQVAQFNQPMNSYLAPGRSSVAQSPAIQTYTVNKNGMIDFPVLGKLHVQGLTKSQVIALITNKVSAYLAEPIVNLQIMSYRVTVLGEVMRPGPIAVSDERITILDAIGAVGDLTIYGNRENVRLIRDNNGKKEFYTINLTKSDIFAAPYYYLQQNDVIVVEPNNTKKRTSNFGSAENYRLSMFSLTFTALSVIIGFLNYSKK
ncbi:MAG: polysaccharide export protein [Dysgonamonadaceae bacterium]|jgi:polysaccharide export outer membrane protein|nr:polysaccharide export protein [Dysgonamonadaceae bacterium]